MVRMSNIVLTIPVKVEATIEEASNGFHAWSICGLHVRGRSEIEAAENIRRTLESHLEYIIKARHESYHDALNYLNRLVGNYNGFIKLINGTIQNVINTHGPITESNCPSVSKRIAGQIWGSFKQEQLEKLSSRVNLKIEK